MRVKRSLRMKGVDANGGAVAVVFIIVSGLAGDRKSRRPCLIRHEPAAHRGHCAAPPHSIGNKSTRRTARRHTARSTRCSAREFSLWGACGHHALLLSELGQLPDPETEIGWPDERKPVPIWERRSTGAASVVSLKLVGD